MSKTTHQILNRKLISDVSVCKPDNLENVVYCKALWDTGALISFISQSIINQLNLESSDNIIIIDGNGNETKSEKYWGFIQLVGHTKTYVIEFGKLQNSRADCQILIGMDIIEQLKLICDKENFEIEET